VTVEDHDKTDGGAVIDSCHIYI